MTIEAADPASLVRYLDKLNADGGNWLLTRLQPQAQNVQGGVRADIVSASKR